MSYTPKYLEHFTMPKGVGELDPNDATRFNRLLFERHIINIEQGQATLMRSESVRRGDREMSLAELGDQFEIRREEAAAAATAVTDGLEGRLTSLLDQADGEAPEGGAEEARSARARALRSAESSLRTQTSTQRQTRL